ncbi:Uncharacterised protein [[Clostridium] sordellii]|nr:Uncharacterised protein [[Clostridium] sordellii] [Paeniclostridium sordellii]
MKEDIKELIEKIEDNRFLEIIYSLIQKRVKK